MITEWNIQKRSSKCSGCEKTFEDTESIYCFLNLENPEELRKDYCQTCWEETKLERAVIEHFSHWQSHYRKPIVVTKEEPVKRDMVEVMLKKYLKSENPAHINLCYILAVMLERKKILTHKDTTKDPSGKSLLIYENHKSGEVFVITDPHLKLGEIAGVQHQVKELLDEEMRQSRPEENPQAENREEESEALSTD